MPRAADKFGPVTRDPVVAAYEPKAVAGQIALLERRLARAEAARARAEAFLEQKSRILALANEELRARKVDLSKSLELRSRQLLEAQRVAKFATLTYDLRQRRLEYSPQTHRMLGLSDRAHHGLRDLIRCVDPRDRRRVIRSLHVKLFGSRRPKRRSEFQVKFRCRRPNSCGPERFLMMMAQQQYDERGQVILLLATIQDVTRQTLSSRQAATFRARERRRLIHLERLNRELEGARLQADFANQAKSRFLAMMSHDIRTCFPWRAGDSRYRLPSPR